MLRFLLLLLPAALATAASYGSSDCANLKGGVCYHHEESCGAGHTYTHYYCGSGQICCWKTEPDSGSSGSSGSSSGHDDTECEMRGGECHSQNSGCPHQFPWYTLNYCGFLKMCCYGPRDHNDVSCTDSNQHCPVWATYGMCKNDAAWMSSHCRKSCNTCDSGKPTPDTPSGGTDTGSSCGVSANEGAHSDRIVGGTTASPAEYPWQVDLIWRGQHMCGGTLISDRHIVSAAHCFQGQLGNYHEWQVGVGFVNNNYVPTSAVHRVARLQVHERYSHSVNKNDISLLTLATPIKFNEHVRPACLPAAREDFEGQYCTVTGWGDLQAGGPGTTHLQEVDLPIISNAQCSYYLGSNAHITATNICAGVEQGGKDACQGDSGGPLVCKKGGVWKLAGVVSWGYGCAERLTPGVYTRVSEYVQWIHDHQ